MEVETECACCGEKTQVFEGSYAVITSTFKEMDDGDYEFYMSAGHHIDDAKEFVTKVRMRGHFAVMMKFEKTQELIGPLKFLDLLEADEYE